MNNKAILLLCVALVIAASVMLTTAVPPEKDDTIPEQAPLQTCVEGETICIGNNSYECASTNQWLLKEANSASCDYEAPVVCTEGETQCFGFNEYQCLNNEWVLTALNNESCGYVCTSGASYCNETDLYICENNDWSVIEDSPSCGYIAPTDVQTNVLTNMETCINCSSGTSTQEVPFEELKTVTLHSGGVSGGIYWENGGVPARAFVDLCEENPHSPSNDYCYYVALPLYSEVSFEGIGYIGLHNVAITNPIPGDPNVVSIASSVIYSYS